MTMSRMLMGVAVLALLLGACATNDEALAERDRIINEKNAKIETLNQQLADWYGVEGIEGREMRRVDLPPDLPRGGRQLAEHRAGSGGKRCFQLDPGNRPDPPFHTDGLCDRR